MTVRELREKYLRFFESKGHLIHDSGSLIPYDVTGRLDESLLFNGAGMVQFKPYFRGIAEPPRKRLTTAQKCVRTGDIDEVGDDSHLTFFEMLGNFSFGDYFKLEAIDYSWEFLTGSEWLGLDPKRLSFTVFETDDDAYNQWAKHLSAAGIAPSTRIFRLGEETNYWPAGAFSSGPPGPCGPNSEMFYWTSTEGLPGTNEGDYSTEQWLADDEAKNWLEIWNDVFIQYEWQGVEGTNGWEKSGMPNLPFLSIDTGMGIERTVAVLNGFKSVYSTDAFTAIFEKLDSMGAKSNGTPDQVEAARRIIADHIRTACFCIADGILPANNGRGYVLRRLIRRAILKGQRTLGFDELFLFQVSESVLEIFGDHYKELRERKDIIAETLKNEEALFRRTLKNGVELFEIRLFDMLEETCFVSGSDPAFLKSLSTPAQILLGHNFGDLVNKSDQAKVDFVAQLFPKRAEIGKIRDEIGRALTTLNGDDVTQFYEKWRFNGFWAFQLYDTYGFPLEVTEELCAEAGITVDLDGFKKAMREAQERSRGAQGEKSAYGNVTGTNGQRQLVLAGKKSSHSPYLTDVHAGVKTKIIGFKVLEQRGREANEFGMTRTGSELWILLEDNPLYLESGGQQSDKATVRIDGTDIQFDLHSNKFEGKEWIFAVGPYRLSEREATDDEIRFRTSIGLDPLPTHVSSTDPQNAKLSEWFEWEAEKALSYLLTEYADKPVTVKLQARAEIQRNHTATHLLQAALRQTLGTHVTQAGSYVGPDNLRFDFTHGKALSREEIDEIERIVNSEILKNTSVTTYVDIPIDEARSRGAMALFGEKYGDKVRMVEVGDFSRELCGGTHVRSTGEIGTFRIVSEASAASGVRRIEAITGESALELAKEEINRLREAANLLKTNPKELIPALERTLDQLKEERKKREKAEMAALSGKSSGSDLKSVKGVDLWIKNFGETDMKIATQAIDNEANGKPNQITLGVVAGEKVTFIAKIGADAVAKGAHAGNLLRELAKITGGGGGGRADYATAGGKDVSKVEEALSSAEQLLEKMIQA
jgi:alanyl-tRNA synthetase